MRASTSAPTTCPVCQGGATPEDRFGDLPLLRCDRCDFVFLAHVSTDDLYDADYFAGYVGGDYLAQEAQRRRESRLRLELLERVTPSPARVLEIGAAAGFFVDEASRRGYEALGIEPNDAMAAHARDALGADVRTGALGEVELAPGSFDAACAFHVLEHLDAPLAALGAVCAALRPGGHVLIEVPNVDSAAARRRGDRWAPLDLPHHVGHYGPRSLRSALAGAGFDVLRIDTVPFALYGAGSRAGLLARGLAEAARARALLPAGPHPHGHQLLRAVARRPAA